MTGLEDVANEGFRIECIIVEEAVTETRSSETTPDVQLCWMSNSVMDILRLQCFCCTFCSSNPLSSCFPSSFSKHNCFICKQHSLPILLFPMLVSLSERQSFLLLFLIKLPLL